MERRLPLTAPPDDTLARLAAEFAAHRAATDAELATLRAALRDRPRVRPTRRRARPFLPVALVALLVALMPLSILANDRFGDVPSSNPHYDDIALIAEAGITRGCNAPDNTLYCPTVGVTRQQMASFLARLGGLGANPPVANAKTAQTARTADNATNAVSAQTAASATTAGNADRLGGRGATTFARVARGTSAFVAPGQLGGTFGGTSAVYPNFAPLPGAEVTILAPDDGFVFVTAVVGVNVFANERAIIRLRDATSGVGAVSRTATVLDPSSPVIDELALTWVFPVTGAGAKTFILEVSQGNATAGDVAFTNDVLTVLYVPFGFDGGSSLAP